jgi:hypothetical protein
MKTASSSGRGLFTLMIPWTCFATYVNSMLWYPVGMSFMINIGPESKDDALFEIFLSGKTDRQVLHTKKWLFSTFNKWSLGIYSTAVLNPLVHPSDQIYNRWKTARRTRALAVKENGEQTSHNTRKVRPNLGSADQVCLLVFRHPLRLLHPMSSYNSIILTFEHSI